MHTIRRRSLFLAAAIAAAGLFTILSASDMAAHSKSDALRSEPAPAADARSAEADTVFFDDFSGAALDRAVWNVIVTGGTVNNEQQAYIDSSSAVSILRDEEGAHDGALVLQAEYRPGFVTPQGKTFDFTSGRIDTRLKAEFTYGTVSARMKLPSGTGYWPAFWMLGRGRWPDVGEIDIMENVGEEDWVSAALHGPKYFGETPLVNKYFFTSGADISSWHVYGVNWTKDTLAFTVDGRLMYRVTRPMVEHYGRWAFDAPKFIILNLALGGAYPVKTNGVDEPYHGLPESTVNAIKHGKGRVVVDWVCVTKAGAAQQISR